MLSRSMCALVLLMICHRPVFAAPPEPTENDLLAGPKVEEQAEKQAGGMMGSENQRGMNRRIELNHQQWMAALRELTLTASQTTEVESLIKEFAKAQREFRASISKDQLALMDRRNSAQDRGQLTAEDRESLRELESRRPKPEPVQQKIWALLTVEQQTQFKAQLDVLRERLMAQREERQQRREAAMQPAAPQPPPPQMEPSPEPRRRANADRANRANRNELDRMAQRRLRFLQSHQRPAHGEARQPGMQPSDQERNFQFDEND